MKPGRGWRRFGSIQKQMIFSRNWMVCVCSGDGTVIWPGKSAFSDLPFTQILTCDTYCDADLSTTSLAPANHATLLQSGILQETYKRHCRFLLCLVWLLVANLSLSTTQSPWPGTSLCSPSPGHLTNKTRFQNIPCETPIMKEALSADYSFQLMIGHERYLLWKDGKEGDGFRHCQGPKIEFWVESLLAIPATSCVFVLVLCIWQTDLNNMHFGDHHTHSICLEPRILMTLLRFEKSPLFRADRWSLTPDISFLIDTPLSLVKTFIDQWSIILWNCKQCWVGPSMNSRMQRMIHIWMEQRTGIKFLCSFRFARHISTDAGWQLGEEDISAGWVLLCMQGKLI